MRPLQNFSSFLLLIFIIIICLKIYHSHAQFDIETDPDDEEDESVEDETPEEKAARKSIQEDSNLTVVSEYLLQSDQPILNHPKSQAYYWAHSIVPVKNMFRWCFVWDGRFVWLRAVAFKSLNTFIIPYSAKKLMRHLPARVIPIRASSQKASQTAIPASLIRVSYSPSPNIFPSL